MQHTEGPQWPMDTIGWVRCSASEVGDVPSEGLPSWVEMRPEYRDALVGIEVGDHMFVVTVFDRADGSTLQGSPGTRDAQGAFSIRSSCRPNRIGMTLSRITEIDGLLIGFEWLDFADRTPVIDLKRYNWRWECVPSARRLDRRHFERQLDLATLARVLARPARNFHGEDCAWVSRCGRLAAQLVLDENLWWGDPGLRIRVSGDEHLVESIQGLTGATVGNGRLTRAGDSSQPTVVIEGPASIVAAWNGERWATAKPRS